MLTKQQYLELITNAAKRHRFTLKQSVINNDHLSQLDGLDEVHFKVYITQYMIDAILIDFINSIAYDEGVDYGLHATDLREPEHHVSTETD